MAEIETVEERLARKVLRGLKSVPEPSSELLGKSMEELNALTDELDRRIAELRQEKGTVHQARVIRARAEHAAYYGLTPEEYDVTKEKAKEGDPELYQRRFQKLLARARKGRAVQIATASIAEIGVKAKGV